jgi:N-acetyl sugar amidotransferase
MPDTRPDTAFVKGICSACLTHDAQKTIDWEQRKNDLMYLLNRQHLNSSGFDCIVASSGGKDSTAQALDLIKLGARPLLVTATTCMLTDIGHKNIQNLARYAATMEVTPNQDVRARLNYLGLTLVGDVSWPEHVAIFTTPMKVATALGIPLVFYGENPQAAYGGPIGADEARQMTRRWVSEFGGFLGLRPADMIGLQGITNLDMLEYMPPSDDAVRKAGVEMHFLGQYLGPWDSRRNAKVAIDAGMKTQLPCTSNWWDFENLDNAMTGLHDYMMYKKYGYGRACPQLSVDIRNGFITRQRGLQLLKTLEFQFPWQYAGVTHKEVLERLDMTGPEMVSILEKFTNRELTWD